MTEVDTPAESPWAKHLDTRISGTSEDDTMNGRLRIARTPPDLPPLPLNPTALDVALRYGSDSAWLRANLPKLVDAVVELQRTVHLQRTTHWAWPLLCGLLASAGAARWAPRLLALFGR